MLNLAAWLGGWDLGVRGLSAFFIPRIQISSRSAGRKGIGAMGYSKGQGTKGGGAAGGGCSGWRFVYLCFKIRPESPALLPFYPQNKNKLPSN